MFNARFLNFNVLIHLELSEDRGLQPLGGSTLGVYRCGACFVQGPDLYEFSRISIVGPECSHAISGFVFFPSFHHWPHNVPVN